MTPIKAALLDQKIVAGLGNIYVCEALFRSGISPQRLAFTVPGARAKRLVPAIKQTLTEAIAAGGSSLRDYVQTSGELGYFQQAWKVYGREGDPCPTCLKDPTCAGVRRNRAVWSQYLLLSQNTALAKATPKRRWRLRERAARQVGRLPLEARQQGLATAFGQKMAKVGPLNRHTADRARGEHIDHLPARLCLLHDIAELCSVAVNRDDLALHDHPVPAQRTRIGRYYKVLARVAVEVGHIAGHGVAAESAHQLALLIRQKTCPAGADRNRQYGGQIERLINRGGKGPGTCD